MDRLARPQVFDLVPDQCRQLLEVECPIEDAFLDMRFHHLADEDCVGARLDFPYYPTLDVYRAFVDNGGSDDFGTGWR